MRIERKMARVNVSVLATLLIVSALLAVMGVVALRMRRQAAADKALAAGRAAINVGDLAVACEQLKIYLEKRPEDLEVLEQFANANLEVRPRSPRNTNWAIKAYRRLLRQRPGDDAICEALAELYLEVRDFNEAAYVCQQRLEVEPLDKDAALTLGSVLVAQRKSQEAADVLKRLIGNHPDQVRAYALLSNEALQEGTSSAEETALKWLDQAVAANPDSAEAKVLRARYFRLVPGDRGTATSDLEDAESKRLTDPNLRLALAEEWLALGEYDRAGVHAKALKELDEAELEAHDIYPPDMMLALFSLDGLLALRQGDKQRAGDVAEQGLAELAEGRRRTAFLPLAAELLIASGNLDAARSCLADYREQVEAVSTSSNAVADNLMFLESLVETAAGNNYEAINRLERVLTSSPRHLRARKLLAASFVSTRQWRQAERQYKEYLKSVPGDATAILQYADACRNGQDLKEYLLAAQNAERLMPNNVQATLVRIDAELRLIERDTGNAAPLKSLAEELESLQVPQDRKSQFDLLRARVSALTGRPDEAIRILEAAIDATPDALLPRLRLVEQFARNGAPEKAMATCREACHRHAKVADPHIILAQLLIEDKQYEEAVAALDEAIPELDDHDKLKVQVFLAQLKMQHEQRPAGVSLLRRLAVEHDQNVELRRVLITLPEVRDNPGEAQRLVDEMRAIEGEGGTRWPVEQARLWLQAEDWEDKAADVEAMLARCIAVDSRWQMPAILLGSMFERLGNDAGAEAIYERVLDNDLRAGAVAERLVALLVRNARFADSDALLQRIQAESPTLTNFRVASAARQGEYGLALEELQRRVAADPQDAESRVKLAQVVYGTLQDADQALALLEEAQAISPDLLEAATTRARIIHLERGPEEAEKILSDEVDRRKDFVAYLARARYFAETGRLDEADQDFTHLTSFPESSAAGFRMLGIFRHTYGRREQAIIAWKDGLQRHPGDVEIKRLLVKALVASGDADERLRGQEMLDGMLAVNPEDADLLYVHATALLGQGTGESIAQADEVLKKVVSLAPRNTSAHLKLIAIASRRGDSEAADELLTRAFAANPDDFALGLTQAELQLEQGNLRIAREMAIRAREKRPQSAGPTLVLATVALRSGDTDLSRTLIEEAVRLEPGNEQAQLLKSQLMYGSGERHQAIESLKEFQESDAGRGLVATRLALAKMCRLTGDLDSASRHLGEAIKLGPDRTDVFVEKLAGLAASERFDDLVKDVEQRLADHPGEYSVLVVAGSLLEATGKPEFIGQAARWYAIVPVEDNAYSPGQLALARIAFQRGDSQDAVAAYRQILAKEPSHYEALNDLAWILGMQLGEMDEAIELADRGVARYPDDPHLLDTRGALLLRAGRYADAQRDLERCLMAAAEIPATRASTLLHLGKVHLKRSDPDQARRRLEEAKSIDEQFKVYTEKQRIELGGLLKEALVLLGKPSPS